MFREKVSSTKIGITDLSTSHDIFTAAKGGGILFLGRVFEQGTQLIFTILVTRALGSTGYGIYILALSVSSILSSIALMGLSEGMMRFIPIEHSKQNNEKIRSILFVGLSISLAFGLGLGLLQYRSAQFFATTIFHEPEVILVLRLASLIVPLQAFGQVLIGVVLGLKQMAYQVYSQSIGYSLVRLGLTALLIFLGLDIRGVIIASAISWVVTIGLLFYYISQTVSLKGPKHISFEEVRELLAFSAPLCLTDLTNQLRGYINLFLVGAIETTASVGVFSAATRVQMAGSMLLGPITKVSKPIISDLSYQYQSERLKQVYQTLTRWSFSIIVPFVVTIYLFAKPILSIFGDDFVGGESALIIIGFGMLINSAAWISQPMISMTGHSKRIFFITTAGLVINIILNLIFIPKWNIFGAALSSVIAICFVSILGVILVYRLVGLLPYNLTFIKPICAGIISLYTGSLLSRSYPADSNFVFLLMDVSLLWLSYIFSTVLLGFSKEERAVLSRAGRRFSEVLKAIALWLLPVLSRAGRRFSEVLKSIGLWLLTVLYRAGRRFSEFLEDRHLMLLDLGYRLKSSSNVSRKTLPLINVLIVVAFLSDLLTPYLIWKGFLPSFTRWISSVVIVIIIADLFFRMLTLNNFPVAIFVIIAFSLIGVTIALQNGQEILATVWGWWLMFKYPLVGVYVYLQPSWSERTPDHLRITCITLLVFEVVFQIGQFLMGESPGDDLVGTFGRHATQSLLSFLLFVLCLVLGQWVVSRQWKNLVWVMILGVVSSVLSETKFFLPASLMLLTLSILFTFIQRGEVFKLLPVIIFMGTSLIIFIVGYNTFVPGADRIPIEKYIMESDTLNSYSNMEYRIQESGAYYLGRNRAITYGWETIIRDPITLIFGMGIGARSESRTLNTAGIAFSGSGGKYIRVSSLLVMMQEMGLLGLVAFGIFIFWVVISLLGVIRRNPKSPIAGLSYALVLFSLFWPLLLYYATVWNQEVLMMLYWFSLGFVFRKVYRMPRNTFALAGGSNLKEEIKL